MSIADRLAKERAEWESFARKEAEDKCPRCNSSMRWTHSSYQCTHCHYKEGCCG